MLNLPLEFGVNLQKRRNSEIIIILEDMLRTYFYVRNVIVVTIETHPTWTLTFI